MCLRYSSSVVAPTARSSPRASIGFRRFAASTAPSAAPAPTMVCSSSMKRMTVPPACLISFRTALRRSSNSPRYFDPASSAPMSSAITRRSRSDSGTSPDSMRCARPSTIAVLPTPGSPMSTGLFFVRGQQMLGGDVLVLEVADLLLGLAQHAHELAGGTCRLAARGHGRQRVEVCVDLGAQRAHVGAELREHRCDDAAVLLEQHAEQVLGRHLRVAASLGELAGSGDGLLGLDGESISLH